MYLSEEQIMKSVNEYIKSNVTQVLMIDGEWGSGKTHFIKNKLKKYLKNEKVMENVVYVSLYGFSTTDEIIKAVYISYSNERLGQDTGIVINKILKYGSAFAGSINIDINKLPGIDEMIELKNTVLIFDDIERCHININELFGYINSFVEHKGIKVLLIANDKEVRKKFDGILSDDTVAETRVATKYDEVKEKIVSNTIKYCADISDKYIQILDEEYSNSLVFECMKSNKNSVVNIMDKEKCINLRTLKFALSAFERFGSTLKERFSNKENLEAPVDKKLPSAEIIQKLFQEKLELELNRILAETLKKSIEIKSPKEVESKDQDYSFSNALNGAYEGLTTYDFVGNYLHNYYINEDQLVDEVKNKILMNIHNDQKKSIDKGLSLNYLATWKRYEDNQIKELSERLLQELRDDKYKTREYGQLIMMLLSLSEYKIIAYNIDEYIDVIASNAMHDKDFMMQRLDLTASIINDENIKNRYVECIDKIKNKIKINLEPSMDLNLILHENIEKFYNYCSNEALEFSSIQGFMKFIKTNELLDIIEKASPGDVIDIKESLELVYVHGREVNFYNDLTNLKNFSIGLLEIKIDGNRRIYKEAFNNLANIVEGIINRIDMKQSSERGDDNNEL